MTIIDARPQDGGPADDLAAYAARYSAAPDELAELAAIAAGQLADRREEAARAGLDRGQPGPGPG